MTSLEIKNFSKLLLIIFLIGALLLSVGCSNEKEEGNPDGKKAEKQQPVQKEKPTLVFADAGWDSIRFHNSVAKTIIENGYGYKTDVIPGSTPATFTGLRRGDINIYMEVWTQNILEVYTEAINSGDVIEVSTNFDDNAQGLYVPTYVIKGDTDKGIKPLAPDLKSVFDLPKYWELFKDPEDPSKGRIVGSPAGWKVDEILSKQMETFKLSEKFNYFRPGSDSALAASITKAVEKGEPWVGYYWEPTWIMGKYDMTLLEAPEYSDEKWNENFGCAFPAVKVTIAVNNKMPETAPDVVEFLKKYKTSSTLTSEALAYMQDNNVDTDAAAKWFLQNKEDIWTKWVPADVADKVKTAIQ